MSAPIWFTESRTQPNWRNVKESKIAQLVRLNSRVRHQGNMPGSLNGRGYLSLVPGTVAGDAPGNDFPALGNKVFQ
jgi:hypothetical protein